MNDKETWVAVENAYGYEVSTLGRLRSWNKRGPGNGWSDKPTILKGTLNQDGYITTFIPINGKRKFIRVHRLIAQIFLPNPENKPQVNHKDGCKTNNCVKNLEWATQEENMRHAWDNNMIPLRKLTPKQVSEIRLSNKSQQELSDMYNICHSNISRIKSGKRYWRV